MFAGPSTLAVCPSPMWVWIPIPSTSPKSDDELTDLLGRTEGLRVVAAVPPNQYKSKVVDAREVARI